MVQREFDLVVIGAGPGGYVAAIRAAQLGMRVACVERGELGGTCLNVGCIPSKALLDSSQRYDEAIHGLAQHGIRIGEVELDLGRMMARKEQVVKHLAGGVGMLFGKHGVEHARGEARIIAPGAVAVAGASGQSLLRAGRILIATGSAPIELPGLAFDGQRILSSTEALSLGAAPRRLLVVGAGYIGVELGSVWRRLGSEVTVVEFGERALAGMDREMAGQLQRMLTRQGLAFRFGTVAESAVVEGEAARVMLVSGGKRETVEVEQVLVCVGRRPVTGGLGLEELGVALDGRGFVRVDERFATGVPGIYAIGDVIGGVMLAHKAEEEGIAAVEGMAGRGGHVNYPACPAVVYTHPELAAVGLSEEAGRARGAVKIGRFPFAANGRARGMGEMAGLVKIIADAGTDRILGVHILGPHASDLIAEATVAMEFAASAEDLARSFHAHPTLPEAVKEAALGVNGRAIHV